MTNSKTIEKTLCLVMLTLCVVMAYVTTVQANNWEDVTWSFRVSNSTATEETDPRIKEDTSKVYIKNLSSSADSVHVSILGRKGTSGSFEDYTYNTSGVTILQPYTVAPNTYKYMSSQVYEKCKPNT